MEMAMLTGGSATDTRSFPEGVGLLPSRKTREDIANPHSERIASVTLEEYNIKIK